MKTKLVEIYHLNITMDCYTELKVHGRVTMYWSKKALYLPTFWGRLAIYFDHGVMNSPNQTQVQVFSDGISKAWRISKKTQGGLGQIRMTEGLLLENLLTCLKTKVTWNLKHHPKMKRKIT